MYIHYVGRDKEYGDAIIACPRVFTEPPPDLSQVFDDGYFIFYPVTAAVAQGLAHVVGHLPSPGMPARFRRAGARVGRHISTWIIQDGPLDTVKSELSEEERRLPLAAIFSHQFLVNRIAEGWRPEMDFDPPASSERLVAGAPTPHVVSHYLYFPIERSAKEVAAALRAKGFQTEERLGADGENWLVLARHEIVPTEARLEEIQSFLESLATQGGGEYDGREVEVHEGEDSIRQ